VVIIVPSGAADHGTTTGPTAPDAVGTRLAGATAGHLIHE
jgi:hypothetical protein